MIAGFNNLTKPLSNNTELNDFLTTYFGRAGSELSPVPEDELETDPTFLANVSSADVSDFIRQVIDIWPELTRRYVGAANCTGCVDSFLPINRTFVIAGGKSCPHRMRMLANIKTGRFREPYYWDSFFIVEGLLRTQGSFTEIARNMIENFLDFVEEFGFVPNGARQYYLNRSQPPLLSQMVRVYVEYTGDRDLLTRALPLLEKEHSFWTNNRSVTITQGSSNYTLNRYAVENTEPRPESYREDYITANNRSYYAESGIIYPEVQALNGVERATLYSELASGAESGWDYSSRWLKNPNDASKDVYFPLRSLNTHNIVPVDLNSILYANEIAIAEFHNATGNSSASRAWADLAAARSASMTALLWDPELSSYFDYNITSQSPNKYVPVDADATSSETADSPAGYQVVFTPAQFAPFWTGAAPSHVKNNPLAIKTAFTRIQEQLERKAGAIPASNLFTGEQWDEPNVWPPLQYIITKGLLNTPPTFGEGDPDYIWTQELALNLSQRYLDSAFCTWRVTGGSTANFSKLPGSAESAVGTIFEKYSDNSTNAAGGGGEYEVVEGFGWSNGVLIWQADIFGGQLQTPDCGNISAADVNVEMAKRSAVNLHKRDAAWIQHHSSRQRKH